MGAMCSCVGLPLLLISLLCWVTRPSSYQRLIDPLLSPSTQRKEMETHRIPQRSEKVSSDCKQQLVPRPLGISNEKKLSHSNSSVSVSLESFPWETLTGQNALFCTMLKPFLPEKGAVENSSRTYN